MQEVYGLEADTIKVVSNDGSPAGQKHWLVWNSPFVSPKVPESGRVHPIQEAARLLLELTKRNIRTIAFCRVRRTCELLMKSVRSELVERNIDGDSKIMAYRGGYSASDRRLIEHEMFSGHLVGIIATNALELGIDIGALDAVIMVGFPFSIANLRQQSGRAGRRSQASLSVLIGGGDPLDQHYMANPQLILNEPVPAIQSLMLDNSLIMENHLQCAAEESPINILNDAQYFGAGSRLSLFKEIVASKLQLITMNFDGEAQEEEEEEPEEERYYTCDSRYLPYPSSNFSLRSLGTTDDDEEYSVIDITGNRNTIIEQIEPSRVSFTLYEGGVFIHQGCTYLIKSVDPQARYAIVEKKELNWITKQRDYTDVDPARTEAVKLLSDSPSILNSAKESNKLTNNGVGSGNTGSSNNSVGFKLQAVFGLVSIRTIVFGFTKLTMSSLNNNGQTSKGFNKIIDVVEIPGPQQRPFEYDANGFWINLPDELINLVKNTKNLSIAAGIHAAEHVILAVMPNCLSRSASMSPIGTLLAEPLDLEPRDLEPIGSENNTNLKSSGSDVLPVAAAKTPLPPTFLRRSILTSAPYLGTECKAPEKEFKQTDSTRKRPARLIFHEKQRRPTTATSSFGGGGGGGGRSNHQNNNNTAGNGYGGLASKAFANLPQILTKAAHLISNCPQACSLGCMACGVTLPGCTENNVVVSKPAATVILRYLAVMIGEHGHQHKRQQNSELDGSQMQQQTAWDLLDLDSIPNGPEENLLFRKMADTVVSSSNAG